MAERPLSTPSVVVRLRPGLDPPELANAPSMPSTGARGRPWVGPGGEKKPRAGKKMKMQIISSLLVDLTLISPCLLHLLRSLCKAMSSPARPLQGTAAGARMCSDALFLPYPCPIPALSLGLTPKKPSDLGDRPASPVGAPGTRPGCHKAPSQVLLLG
jgi:hypothetical protein